MIALILIVLWSLVGVGAWVEIHKLSHWAQREQRRLRMSPRYKLLLLACGPLVWLPMGAMWVLGRSMKS
jgi:hypothetical protein